MGDFYYVASSIPDRAFDTRKKAVEASLAPPHPPPPQEPSRDHYVEMIEKRQREDRLMREDRAIYEARHK